MKKIKKYTQFINENFDENKADFYAQDTYKDPDAYSESEDMLSDEDNIWFVMDNGNPVSGWSYLKDAIKDGILSDNQEVGDEYDMDEDIDSYLSENGWGEDYEEMEEYDQGILDGFVEELIQKYAPSSSNLRVVKKTELI